MKISKALLFAALLTSVGTAHANCANQPNTNTPGPAARVAAAARADQVLPPKGTPPPTPAPTATTETQLNGGGG